MNKATAIIPFHDETESLLSVIEILNKIDTIAEIILVDDGSKNNLSEKIISRVDYTKKNIQLHFTGKNIGKSRAIGYGLEHSSYNTIFLLDADIKNPSLSDFETALNDFFNHKADMLILKRINSLMTLKIIRANTLLSGERIVKKELLQKVLKKGINGYEIELALNQHMINYDKLVLCRPNSAKNTYKFVKSGLLKGISRDVKMYYNIISYIGAKNYLKQWLFFAKTKNNKK